MVLNAILSTIYRLMLLRVPLLDMFSAGILSSTTFLLTNLEYDNLLEKAEHSGKDYTIALDKKTKRGIC